MLCEGQLTGIVTMPWQSLVFVKYFKTPTIHCAMAKHFFQHSNYKMWCLEIDYGRQPR